LLPGISGGLYFLTFLVTILLIVRWPILDAKYNQEAPKIFGITAPWRQMSLHPYRDQDQNSSRDHEQTIG
jgi:hypothetical protein